MIKADGRQLYRAIENLYTNAAKYALENTRVYVELDVDKDHAIFTIKNVSKTPLVAQEEGGKDLTARFVRGEESRTTEGSGLGLSIAKNLTNLMGGEFDITVMEICLLQQSHSRLLRRSKHRNRMRMDGSLAGKC